MLIKKHNNNNSNNAHTIKFKDFVSQLELYTGVKQNRISLNYRLLNNESIFVNDFTYFNRIIK